MDDDFNQKKSSGGKTGPLGEIGESTDPFEVIGFLVVISVIGGYIATKMIGFFSSDKPFFEAFKDYIDKILPFVNVITFVITAVFTIGIIYSLRKLSKLNRELKLKFHSQISQSSDFSNSPKNVNKRWQKTLKYIESSNMSDWKLAILEADVMLEEMVDEIGYKGESLGDKLQNVERSDFNTADKAFEAHQIRNSIAKEGSSFLLTQTEAHRVISLYKEVFQEFKYI